MACGGNPTVAVENQPAAGGDGRAADLLPGGEGKQVGTSALGVWIGSRLLQVMPLHRLHQLSGVLFLALAGLALTRAI